MSQSDASEVNNVVFTVGNHLVGNLDEKSSHSLVCVVVSSDGVNHLDGVHKGGKSVLDRLGCAFIKWLNELFKSLEVLNVVFGFVEGLSDTELNASPFAGGKVDLVSWSVSIVSGVLSCGCQDIEDGSAVLGSELLGDAGKFSHALFPVFKFLAGTSFFVVLLFGLGLFKSLFDFFRPLVEDFFEVVNHLRVDCLGGVDALSIFLPVLGVWVQHDV